MYLIKLGGIISLQCYTPRNKGSKWFFEELHNSGRTLGFTTHNKKGSVRPTAFYTKKTVLDKCKGFHSSHTYTCMDLYLAYMPTYIIQACRLLMPVIYVQAPTPQFRMVLGRRGSRPPCPVSRGAGGASLCPFTTK